MISFVGKSIRPLIEDFNHCDEMKEVLVPNTYLSTIRKLDEFSDWGQLLYKKNAVKSHPMCTLLQKRLKAF